MLFASDYQRSPIVHLTTVHRPLLEGFFRFWPKTYFYDLCGLSGSTMMGASDYDTIKPI